MEAGFVSGSAREPLTAYREALAACADRYELMVAEDDPDLRAFIRDFQERVRDYPLMKLNRWLGYIQGSLISSGVTTIAAERDWTRPLFRPLDFTERSASLGDDALRVVRNAYGTNPRHTRGRDGGCRDDCIPCGIARLAAHFPNDGIAVRVRSFTNMGGQ